MVVTSLLTKLNHAEAAAAAVLVVADGVVVVLVAAAADTMEVVDTGDVKVGTVAVMEVVVTGDMVVVVIVMAVEVIVTQEVVVHQKEAGGIRDKFRNIGFNSFGLKTTNMFLCWVFV